MFAGVMMLIVGILQALDGIAALVNDKVYVTTPKRLSRDSWNLRWRSPA